MCIPGARTIFRIKTNLTAPAINSVSTALVARARVTRREKQFVQIAWKKCQRQMEKCKHLHLGATELY